MTTYCIETYGCQMNLADSELIAGILRAAGWEPVDEPAAADVILFNTCTVRERAAERAIGRVRSLARLKQSRPGRRLVLVGCLAQHRGAELAELLPEADLLIGPDGYRDLPQLLIGPVDPRERTVIARHREETYADLPIERGSGINAWVSIMRGCDRACAYCAVPLARGRERSRPAAGILEEVARAVAAGHPAITLLGQTVTSYRHGRHDFAALIGELSRLPGLLRLRFLAAHPADFTPHLIDALAANPVVAPHFHLPLQSGSSRILEAMRRPYTREAFLDLVARVRGAIPGVGITTDLIVGFPGERDEDFRQTLAVMDAVRFDSAFMFAYSPRERTFAARFLDDDVAPEVKQARLTEVIDLQQQHSLGRFSAQIGATREVLIEGPAKGSPERLFGRSGDFKAVVLAPRRTPPVRAGDLVRVAITAASSHTLSGRQVS